MWVIIIFLLPTPLYLVGSCEQGLGHNLKIWTFKVMKNASGRDRKDMEKEQVKTRKVIEELHEIEK